MLLVTLEEARDRLPELIRLMAAGEKVVLVDGDKWVAALATPPPMPEDDAVLEARARAAIRETVRTWVAEGVQLPGDSPLLKLLREEG